MMPPQKTSPTPSQNTPLTLRLQAAWKQAVLADQVINQFEAVLDDPAGRWAKGDRITYGVKFLNQQFVYYAHNLSQDCEIQGATAQKQVPGQAGYLCRLNSYRALRPGAGRRPLGRQPDIPPEPENCRFHCQDPTHPMSLLRRSPLLTVPLKHFVWRAYYNVAPIDAQGHFLWVPTPCDRPDDLQHVLQRLTPELITDAVQLFGQLSECVFFFNALHAGASVNHIHFQSVWQQQFLPIEAGSTQDYNGYQLLESYPVQAAVFELSSGSHTRSRADVQCLRLIAYIEALQQAEIPFNLALLSQRAFVVARDANQAIVSEFPGDGLASLGMCGAIATVNCQAFDRVTAATIESAFGKMVIPATQIIDRLT